MTPDRNPELSFEHSSKPRNLHRATRRLNGSRMKLRSRFERKRFEQVFHTFRDSQDGRQRSIPHTLGIKSTIHSFAQACLSQPRAPPGNRQITWVRETVSEKCRRNLPRVWNKITRQSAMNADVADDFLQTDAPSATRNERSKRRDTKCEPIV